MSEKSKWIKGDDKKPLEPAETKPQSTETKKKSTREKMYGKQE